MYIDFSGLCIQMFLCIISKWTESNPDATKDFKDDLHFNGYCPA